MTTLTGLGHLLSAHLDRFSRKRVGLVTNAAGVTRDLQRNVDALRAAGVDLVALYSPEHGLTGAADHGVSVSSGRDARTGLPVHSLYGQQFKPTREMLAGIDLLLFDLQDVGARFYTFAFTLAKTLEACAELNVPFVVLDRPNPIGGVLVEGPVLDPKLQSTVGHGPIPVRYALTIGELARFYNRELNIGADLQVIPLKNWKRGMCHVDTGLPWVSPSPNIPHPETALLYPGTCLIEGTNLSAGRGTPLPFEIAGAPWVDGDALAAELNSLRLPGVRFRSMSFTPGSDKLAGQPCAGVQVHVTDREALRPVTVGLHLIAAVRRLCPAQFEWRAGHFDKLIGDGTARERIDRGEPVEAMLSAWLPGQDDYLTKRASYLLYDAES